jgi:hypothetical protein
MAIDESKPPKGWHAASDPGTGEPRGYFEREPEDVETLAEAHGIARDEAQPYIAEALERIAYWIGSYDTAAEWRRDDADCDEPEWLRRQILAMARGERQLPVIRDGIEQVESEHSGGIHDALDPEDDDDQTGVPHGYSVGQWQRLEEDHSFTPTGEWSASTDKTFSVGVTYATREAAIRACEAHRDRVIAGAKP